MHIHTTILYAESDNLGRSVFCHNSGIFCQGRYIADMGYDTEKYVDCHGNEAGTCMTVCMYM